MKKFLAYLGKMDFDFLSNLEAVTNCFKLLNHISNTSTIFSKLDAQICLMLIRLCKIF